MAVDLLGNVKTKDSNKKKNYFGSSKEERVIELEEDSVMNDDNSDNAILFQNIRNEIETMEINRQTVAKLKSRFYSSASTEQDKQINEEFEKVIEINTNLTRKIAAQIKNEQSKLEKKGGGTQHQKTQLNTVNNNFKNTCVSFEKAVNDFMSSIKNKNVRQIKMLDYNKNLKDDDIEKIVDNPDQARDFIQKQFAMSDVSEEMLDHIAGLEDKYEGMKKIQEDVAVLHALFQDLQVLVNEQQEQFDSIEQHVDDTKENVSKGVVHLESAEKKQKCNRKMTMYGMMCMCCLLLFVIIILVVMKS